MEYQYSRQFSISLQVVIACVIGLLLGIICVWVPPFLVTAVILGIVYLTLIIIWPELALLILLAVDATIFDSDILPSLSIGVGHLQITDILIFVPLAIILVRAIIENGFRFIHSPLDIPLLSFYVTAILTTVLAIYQASVTFDQSLYEVRTINYILTFFIVTNSIRNSKSLRRLIDGFFLMAVIVSVAMIIQYALGNLAILLPGRVETLDTAGMVSPGITRILPPGQSIVLVALIGIIGLLIFDNNRAKALSRYIQLFIIGTAVLLTFNRSFWVALIVAVLYIIIFSSLREKFRILKVGLWVFLIGSILFSPFLIFMASQTENLVDSSINRISTLFNPETVNESSLQWRWIENEYAYQQILEHPIMGLGLGADYRKWDKRIDYTLEQWDQFRYIHNAHLWLMLKTGILGYVLFFLTISMFLWRGTRAWFGNLPGYYKGIIISFSAAILGLIPCAIFNPVLEMPCWVTVIGIMLGIGEVILTLSRNNALDVPAKSSLAEIGLPLLP